MDLVWTSPTARWRMACILLGLLVCCFSGLLTSKAHARASLFEVESYKTDFGVSAAKAEGTLRTQSQGAGLPIRLEQRLGRSYAGIWFDNAQGEFVVPLLSEARRPLVDGQFASVDLQDEDFRIVPAQSSWEELEAAQKRINDALLPLIEAGLVETGLDTQANAVAIYEAGDLDKQSKLDIQAVSNRESVAVEVREGDAKVFRAEPAACVAIVPRHCGNPLRGGVALTRIVPPFAAAVVGECSTGFKALGKTFGNRFVLTAGHCADKYLHWESADAQGNWYPIGTVEQYSYPGGDWAKINANGSNWDIPSWPSQVAWWGVNQSHPIEAESWSYPGQYVCHSGNVTGASCGYVTMLGYTAGYGVKNLTKFAGAGLCIFEGDSGGPVFAGNTALGILSGVDAETPECQRTGYFVEITEATDAMGVSVAPRLGAPPLYWHSPYGLGGQIVEEPDVASWGPGRLDVFVRGTNDALVTKYYTGGTWSNWVNLGGPALNSAPGAVSWGSNRLDVVARAANGTVNHWWYDGSKWTNENLGGSIVGSPDISSWGGGRLDIFARGSDNTLKHKWFANGSWSAWESRGGVLTSGPGAVSWGPNRIDVVARTTNADVAHWWYDGTWHGDNLGGVIVGDPDISSWGPGRLDLFARGTNDALHHNWYNGSWHGWENKGGTLTSGPGAVSWGQDRIDVFGRATDGSVAQWWYGY